MTRSVLLGDRRFALSGPPRAIGQPVRLVGGDSHTCTMYVAPSLEYWPPAPAASFAMAARSLARPAALLVASADTPSVAEAWARTAGWRPVPFERALAERLGLWIARLSLPARALLVADAAGRLRHREIVDNVACEVDFDAALTCLEDLAGPVSGTPN